MTEVRSDVYARLKGPLLTLMASGTPELVHTVRVVKSSFLPEHPLIYFVLFLLSV